MPDILPIAYSFLFAHSSFSFSRSHCPCPNPFLDEFNAHFPALPVCIVSLPSLCVSYSAWCLPCFVFCCLSPSGLTPPWQVWSWLTVPPQGLSLELLQRTQDGWSQTERLLTALRLQPGEGTPAAVSSTPIASPASFRYLPLHGHFCSQNAEDSVSQMWLDFPKG